MSRLAPLAAILGLAAVLAAPGPARAGSWGNTQHGGRATGQAGAFVARASDPSAITYNPAGIANLGGIQILGGLDFANATDEYSSASGEHRANHTIQFPPALYLTYHLPGAESPWAVGLGVDTPYWSSVDWDTALFPGRFLTRETRLRLWEVHPVVAYEIDERWSLGGGLRYLFGELDLGQNFAGSLPAIPGVRPVVPFEVEFTADGSVDAFSFDVGVQYATNVWGWGAVYRHGAELDSTDSYEVSVRDITIPALAGQVESNLGVLVARQSFELPWEMVTGFWIAPYPELRIELDVALAAWSQSETRIVDPRTQGPVLGGVVQTRTRSWDDTLSVRLGVEGDLTSRWAVYGGIALEPSPVPDRNIEPGFARGDALVYAAGLSYNLSWISFDLGYSYWDHDDRTTTGQELSRPTLQSTYRAQDQIWSVSARWRY
ncbi:MAG TPA: outer membrane protein transport protein [Thermoanaerobaculia bacterium]|nr:outer membrane protein transport protein [Thermoanaerobaculia bacterium]